MKSWERINSPVGFEKQDIWSDWRDQFYDSVGIDQKTRDALQPVVKEVKSLLPKGGAIIEQGAGNASIPQATGFSFQSDMNPYMVIGGAIALGAVLWYSLK